MLVGEKLLYKMHGLKIKMVIFKWLVRGGHSWRLDCILIQIKMFIILKWLPLSKHGQYTRVCYLAILIGNYCLV